jgi:DNA-binding CsgD family transcriptional regulator
MSLQHEITLLKKELEELFANSPVTPSPENEKKKMILAESYGLEQHIADCSKSLFELNSGNFYSHHSVYEPMLGHPVIAGGEKLYSARWIDLTHPDDVLFILQLIKNTIQFVHTLTYKEMEKFCLSYVHRIKNVRHEYDFFIVSYRIMLNNDSGKPELVVLNYKQCETMPLKNENLFRLIHVQPTSLFKKSKLFKGVDYFMFTKMEMLIVREVNKGKSCKEIACEQHISEVTITKHWRNINSKTGIKTTKQACLFAKQLGIMHAQQMQTVE